MPAHRATAIRTESEKIVNGIALRELVSDHFNLKTHLADRKSHDITAALFSLFYAFLVQG